MKIVFCVPSPSDAVDQWMDGFARLLPGARLFLWNEGMPGFDADYAVVRKPSAPFFAAHPGLKAAFNLGAGIEGLLRLDALPPSLAIVKLDDAGMGRQMTDYVEWAVLRHFRQFDLYERQSRECQWKPLQAPLHADLPIGVMGLGVLGAIVGAQLARRGFPVHGWSRQRKVIEGITSHAGESEFDAFLAQTRMLICMLPLTGATEGILNRHSLGRLKPGGWLINVARGAHLVEEDLLALLDSGHLAGATLDVTRQEPLPSRHPFWAHPKITVTPHISAQVLREESSRQVVGKLQALARGEPISGVVDRSLQY